MQELQSAMKHDAMKQVMRASGAGVFGSCCARARGLCPDGIAAAGGRRAWQPDWAVTSTGWSAAASSIIQLSRNLMA
jgi:hypothetical protein